MPLYEYHCEACGKRFELLRRLTDSDRDVKCPDCQSNRVERDFSTFASSGPAPSPAGCGGGGGRFT